MASLFPQDQVHTLWCNLQDLFWPATVHSLVFPTSYLTTSYSELLLTFLTFLLSLCLTQSYSLSALCIRLILILLRSLPCPMLCPPELCAYPLWHTQCCPLPGYAPHWNDSSLRAGAKSVWFLYVSSYLPEWAWQWVDSSQRVALSALS